MFTAAGLPVRALGEPDFPISLEQDLALCAAIARAVADAHSPAFVLFGALDRMGIDNMGVLGMAMRHAATATDALSVCLSFPQLSWGHSRLVVSNDGEATRFSFAMARPRLRDTASEDIDRLVEYCLLLDLLTSLRNIEDIVQSGATPRCITLPFPQPHDWPLLPRPLPCPVHFDAGEACLVYPAALGASPLPRANPLVYSSYVSIARKLSQMLGEDLGVKERVTRWLWAYTPPPRRGEIASLLAMSERSLTRQLGREGSSYAELLASVQAERAKNFLRTTSLSVADISRRLGYAEVAAFSRAFSKWTGLSPLKWRATTAQQG